MATRAGIEGTGTSVAGAAAEAVGVQMPCDVREPSNIACACVCACVCVCVRVQVQMAIPATRHKLIEDLIRTEKQYVYGAHRNGCRSRRVCLRMGCVVSQILT